MYFNPFFNKPWFLPVCSTSILKTLCGKEKLLIMSFSLEDFIICRLRKGLDPVKS